VTYFGTLHNNEEMEVAVYEWQQVQQLSSTQHILSTHAQKGQMHEGAQGYNNYTEVQ
jgi:hypothetical protein